MAADAKMDVDAHLSRRNLEELASGLQAEIVARLNKAVAGKLAQDADIEDVVEMLDRLDDVTDELDDADAPLAIADPSDAPADDDGDLISKVKALVAGASPAEIDALIAALKPADTTPVAAGDADDDDEDDKPASDKEPPMTKAAMDAAIAVAIKVAADTAEKRTIARLRAVQDAERFVRPWVGDLVMAEDSAEGVLRIALETLGIDGVDALHPSAYRHVLAAQPKPGAVAPSVRARVAMDSKVDADLAKKFPGLNALKQR
jgi:hypothetical protein